MEVHNELGYGFLEGVYQQALEYEFTLRHIPAVREVGLPVFYKGMRLDKSYYADFICYDKIIVELKAVSGLTNEHMSQIMNYLKATEMKLGLLINFGTSKMQYKRIIWDHLYSEDDKRSTDTHRFTQINNNLICDHLCSSVDDQEDLC